MNTLEVGHIPQNVRGPFTISFGDGKPLAVVQTREELENLRVDFEPNQTEATISVAYEVP